MSPIVLISAAEKRFNACVSDENAPIFDFYGVGVLSLG